MRPNIIQIIADDMGYGDLSAFNGGLSETPRLDALMAEGVTLTEHYAAAPVCNPARACLLTGRYPHRTGSIDVSEWWGTERLALRERTMADYLKRAGYATGLVGKWHLGSYAPEYHPNRRGFDETVCFRGGAHDYYQWRLEYGDRVRRSDGRYLTDVFTEEAVGFIERHQSEPFYLHLAYNAPHDPLQAPYEDVKPFLDKPGINVTVAKIYGMLRAMDRGIGQVLDTLSELGLTDNTIVLFSSDNGPNLHPAADGPSDRFNCGLRGRKTECYEGGIKIPMIVRWPDGLPRDKSIGDFVHFADWFPTLLAAAGVDPHDGPAIDGVNVLPIMRGVIRDAPPVRCWQWNRMHPNLHCNAAIRDGDWKLLRPHIPDFLNVPHEAHWLHVSIFGPEHFEHYGIIDRPYPEIALGPPLPEALFNIAADPNETTDLAADHPELLSRLSRQLDAWFEDVERDRRDTAEYQDRVRRDALWRENEIVYSANPTGWGR